MLNMSKLRARLEGSTIDWQYTEQEGPDTLRLDYEGGVSVWISESGSTDGLEYFPRHIQTKVHKIIKDCAK